jgi:hypothetical protein
MLEVPLTSDNDFFPCGVCGDGAPKGQVMNCCEDCQRLYGSCCNSPDRDLCKECWEKGS